MADMIKYLVPLEENVTGIEITDDRDIASLGLNEVFIVRFDPEKSYLETADLLVTFGLLVLVFLVGVYASIQAGEMKFLVKLMPFLAPAEKDRGEVVRDAQSIRSSINSNAEKPNTFTNLEEGETEEFNAATDFFLADRSMGFWFVGASLFASNIGSEHFVGQSGDGARRGLAVAMYEWYAALLLLALGWIFAPVYRRSGIYTTPEFLERRFSAESRHYLSFITCIIYVVAKLSASIYGGSLILSDTLGWNIYLAAGLCIVLSAVYTIAGGLRAVMYTDLFQTFVFVIGGFVVMGITLNYVNGYSGLQDRLEAQNKASFWKLWKPVDDPEYPVTGMMFGQPFTSIWYWCMDQDLVQRVLSARNDVHQKAGCTMAAFLKIIPPFIMIIPGIAATTLFQFRYTSDPHFDEILDTYYNTSTGGDYLATDKAYSVILTQLMPAGMRGVMIASIMTAMMSSLDSVFNAGSTIVSNDFYLVARPEATPRELKWVGRVATVLFAVASFLWIPIIQGAPGLYRIVAEIQGYLGPPIGLLICVAVMWKRANAHGAMWGLACGGTMGIARLIVNVAIGADPDTLGIFFRIPFLHFSIILWVVTLFVTVAVSLVTDAPKENMDPFMVQWKDIFKAHEDSAHYSENVLRATNGGAVAILITTFSIWFAFL